MNKKVIAVVGDSSVNSDTYELAYDVGCTLVENGYAIQCGGLGGVMEAVCKGARSSIKYSFGDTIAIIPSYARNQSNAYADIIIPTGIEIMRNGIVVNADAVVAIGGGAGTLSEIALAWSMFKLIIAFNNVNGWGMKLSNQKIDNRNRYPNIPEDSVYGVSSPKEMVEYLNKYIELYKRQYKGVVWKND